MFKRQRTGSVVCPSCGNLVGVNDERCYNCGRRNPGMWGFAPVLRHLGNDFGFTAVIIGGNTLIYVLTLLASDGHIGMSGLFSLLAPSSQALFLFGASGAMPVFEFGRWWTILSASWLHGNLLHILFNMMWVRQLAPATGQLYGASRLVIIYTVAGAAGFLLSSIAGVLLPGVPLIGGASFTIGASAAIFGLLGALVRYSHRTGSSLVGTQAWSWAVMLFVFGLIMPGVDNWAHAGGFAGGYLASMWLDPLRAERTDHVVVALACLVMTFAAVAASIVQGLSLLRAAG
jgi:membrane associated rhomboid family serine protease